MNFQIANADGSYLFDNAGKRYINLSESINILGHKNPELLSLLFSYLRHGYLHYPLTISTSEIAREVEKKLLSLSNLNAGESIFSSSGSEACDLALTVLSEFGPVIILQGAYHGLCGQYLIKDQFDELKYQNQFNTSFPYTHDNFGDIEHLINKGAKSIILEVIQVESGIREVYNGFLQDLKHEFPDLIVCIDESYTGIGKTGKMFAYQWHNFVPEMVILGKAIGGGIPLGITLINEEIYKRSNNVKKMRNKSFGSTAGNILGLNFANFILNKVSQEQFLKDVQSKGHLFVKTVGNDFSTLISGKGLIYGIRSDDRVIDDYINKLLKLGVYVTKMRNAIRISPPLTISEELITESGQKIKSVLSGI
jgi:acetylornithine/N-succinyldiaminopimelate aminotransferase